MYTGSASRFLLVLFRLLFNFRMILFLLVFPGAFLYPSLPNRFWMDQYKFWCIDLVVLRREGETGSKLKSKLKSISTVLETVLPEVGIEGITHKKGMNLPVKR